MQPAGLPGNAGKPTHISLFIITVWVSIKIVLIIVFHCPNLLLQFEKFEYKFNYHMRKILFTQCYIIQLQSFGLNPCKNIGTAK
jgi:hypothetical protein